MSWPLEQFKNETDSKAIYRNFLLESESVSSIMQVLFMWEKLGDYLGNRPLSPAPQQQWSTSQGNS